MAIAGLYKIFDHWHATGTVHIYSDPHFGDKDLAAAQPDRPSDDAQIKLINSKVGRKDTLIILGDVNDIECVRKLRGYKVLIMGNHDSGRTNYERHRESVIVSVKEFSKEEAMEEMKRRYPGYQIDFKGMGVLGWIFYIDNHLFDEVYEGPLMISEKLILSHEPVDIPWAYNIHGHIHDTRHRDDKRHFNVCAEAINFTPINFNQWMKAGHLSRVETIHRATIDTATAKKRKRGGKKING